MMSTERIERERARTRVMDGQRVWVQVREAMRFGNSEMPGAIIVTRPTHEPETDWEVTGAGDLPFLDCQWEQFRVPVREEWRPNVRNSIGGMGAFVTIWPERDECEAWIRACVKHVQTLSRVY